LAVFVPQHFSQLIFAHYLGVISAWSFVDNSFFAIGNYKSVKYSLVVWPIAAALFLISDYMYSSEVLYNLLGVLLGFIWGITLPYARKKEWDSFIALIFLGLTVLVNSFVSQKMGIAAAFQVLLLALFCSHFIWYIFKNRLLTYLSSKSEIAYNKQIN
jgi:hypothetical protein